MFSRTTIASSIRMPIANDSPSSDMVSSLKPSAHTAMKLASTEIGSATPVMTVERHEFRNTNTTRTVRIAPRNSASSTLLTAWSTRTPESFTSSILVPFGRVFSICVKPIAHLRRDVGRAVATRLLDVDADGFLVVVQRERPRLFRRVLDGRDLAETNELTVAVGHDEIVELRGILQATAKANRALVECAVHASDRGREVLRLQRLHDLRNADIRGLKPVRIDLDRQLAFHLAEDLYVGHTLNRAQLARDAGIGESRQFGRRKHGR